MRIRGVRTVVYEYAAVRPIGDVQLPHGARRVADVAVFLTTDEEPVGVGLASPAARPLVHSIGEELVGHDPREVRGVPAGRDGDQPMNWLFPSSGTTIPADADAATSHRPVSRWQAIRSVLSRSGLTRTTVWSSSHWTSQATPPLPV